jgi:glycosyltransferase involved in cell wall biosynthesis
MLLTIGMMVKNEEKHLAECLSSLDSIREEIDSELVIVDTGSDDNTVEIAKEYTDKVYFHEWNDNFSEMRNTVIDYANGDWFFTLDGDEVVANPETVIDFFKSGKYKKYNTAMMTQKNYTNLEDNRFSKILQPRLFKNKDFYYKGAIHNQPQYKKPIYKSNTIIEHYGYVASDKELIERKFQRTSNILKQELENEPDNVYYWFQLSKSYNMHGDQEDALDAIEEAYKVARENNLDLSIRMYILIQLTKMYLINNRYKMAEKFAKNALDIKDGYVDLYYYLARAQLLQGKKEKSLNSFAKYITLIDNYDQTNSKIDTAVDDETMGNYNIAYRFIVALAADLEIETDYAINSAFKIDIDSQLQYAIHPFISICLNNKRYKELKKFYNEQLENNNLKKNFINLLEKLKSNLIIEEKKKVNFLFTDLEDNREYSLLNKVRENIYQESYKTDVTQLSDINYNKKADYYGDVVYLLLKMKNNSAYKLLTDIREENLNRFIKYLNDKYEDLSDVMMSFINLEIKGIAEARVNKSLSRYLLALDNEVEKTNKTIIDNYLNSGTKYIEKLYTKEIIENELIFELKSEEEAFLLYMKKAFDIKKENLKSYIQYLRKAIDIYPLMKKVVKTLMLEVKEKEKKINEELEKRKKDFKFRIEKLINKGRIEESKKLIIKYEQNFERDADIYSILGTISIYEGNLDKAKEILIEGLINNYYNFDILYNLAFIFEKTGKYLEAHTAYILAKRNVDDEKIKEELQQKIMCIRKNTHLKNNIFIKEKIILYGNSQDCDIVLENLNYRFEIVAFVDEQVKNKNDVGGIPVISIDEITNYDYDYIIITEKNNDKSLEHENELKKIIHIKKDKIYPYFRKKRQLIIEGFDHKIQDLMTKNNIELIVTGMSYAEVGIDEKVFAENTFNFALASQDIFYDYQVLKYVLQFKNIKNSLKHVILNLAYFAFDYDMSRKISRNRVHRYFDYFNTTNNNNDVLSVKLLDAEYVKKMDRNSYIKMTHKKLKNKMDKSTMKQTKNYARYHSNMKHDSIAKENKKIFKKYLDLLKKHDINPTIVVFPVTNYYYDNFSYAMKKRFYKVINEFKEEYNFRVLDYFDTDLLEYKHFWDGSHLNKDGANKFSKILRKEIDVLED